MEGFGRKRKNYTAYWGIERFFGNKTDSLVHAYMHANYNYPMHSHQFYEINIVMKGSGTHLLETAKLPAVEGDVFVIPPEIFHSYISDSSVDVFHIVISPEFFMRYQKELEALPGYRELFNIEPYIRGTAGDSCNLRLSYRRLERVAYELDRIVRAEREGLFVYENILTLSLLSELCVRFDRSLRRPEVGESVSLEMMKIMGFIDENLDQKLTVDVLCNFSNMSRATLNRLFQRLLNSSPMKYVAARRTERATELLDAGKMNKSEIAQLCGFYDSAHMNKYISKRK